MDRAPSGHFRFFEDLIEGMIESKNLFSKSCLGGPITKGFTYFQTLSAILDSAGGEVLQAVRCCRRCGVAGGGGVPPAPLGWY